MKRIVLLFVCIFSAYKAFSQFNDTINYKLYYSGTGTINSTNEGTSYILNNTLQFNIRKKNVEVNTSGNWIYGEDVIKKTNNDFNANVDFNLFKGLQKFYYWGLAGYEKSFSLKIIDRFQVGAGVGYNLFDTETFKLILSDGLLYERSNLKEMDKYGRSQYETVRNSFRIKFRLSIRDLMILEGSDFLQNSLADKHDYIIRSNTSLSFKIKKWLSLTTSVTYNRLNLTGTENLIFNYGLSMEKYF